MHRGIAAFFALTLTALLAGCASSGNHAASNTSAEKPKTDEAKSTQSAAPTTTTQAAPAPAATPDTKAAELAEKEKAKTKAERDLRIAKMNFEKTKLTHENQRVGQAQAVERMAFEFDLMKKRHEIYMNEEIPNRIKRQELNMKYQRENVQSNREELEQLEKMYKDEQFADATKDIVVERARRSLDNALKSLEISESENRIFLDKTLPYEKEERKRGLDDKTRQIEQNARDWKIGEIDREIAIINQEAEIQRLADELKKVTDELEKLKAPKPVAAVESSSTVASTSGR